MEHVLNTLSTHRKQRGLLHTLKSSLYFKEFMGTKLGWLEIPHGDGQDQGQLQSQHFSNKMWNDSQ
jgi:hypothetical protein